MEQRDERSVNINTAGVGDFMKIRGVGRRTAEAIVSFRNQRGPLRSIEDLKRVDGISDVLMERIGRRMRA